MLQTVKISSKRQITIPSRFFEALGMNEGDHLLAEKKDYSLILTPAEALVYQLAGVIKSPRKLSDQDIKTMIKHSKQDYFKRKYKK